MFDLETIQEMHSEIHKKKTQKRKIKSKNGIKIKNYPEQYKLNNRRK